MLDRVAILAAAALVCIWIVYPLAIGLVSALIKRTLAPGTAHGGGIGLPRVSVVIATRESTDAVRRRVSNCLATDYPRDLIDIVVARDAESAQEGAEALGSDPRVRVVAGDPPGGKALSLNAGVRASRGEVIVFMDTHQTFEPDTIGRLVDALAEPSTGGVSGSLSLAAGSGPVVSAYWRYERWVRKAESDVHSCVGVTGAVWAMKRELWSPLPGGLILDDVYTPMRIVLAGRRIRFLPSARAYETRTPDPRQEYGRKVRTLTGVLQLCAWLPAVLVPVRNIVWLQFVFHKLLRLITPYLLALLAVWAAVTIWTSLGGAAIPLAAVSGVVLLWFARTRNPTAACVRRLAAEALLLQVAVIVAGYNGIRGRWEVWGGRG